MQTSNDHKILEQQPVYGEWPLSTLSSIIRANIICERWINTTSRDLGIKLLAQAIINALFENSGGMEQGKLIKYLRRSRQSINTALFNLENKGLISRNKDSTDKRKRLISLTEKGWDFGNKMRPYHNRFFNIISSCFTEKESRKLTSMLDSLSYAINDDLKLLSKGK